MYDPLGHYIKEGLVILYSFPSPDDFNRTQVRMHKAKGVEVSLKKFRGVKCLGVKTGESIPGVPEVMAYPIGEDFYETYTVRVLSKDEAIEKGNQWAAELHEIESMPAPYFSA